MEIKGTSVRGTYEYVKKLFPEKLELWVDNLPESSRDIMSNLVLSNKWYPIQDGLIAPIQLISTMLYDGDEVNTAFIMGRYHADITLTGIYKFFVKNSPWFIIERGLRVFSTYFQPCEMKIVNLGKNKIAIHLLFFPEPHNIVDASIAGWTERAIEISGGINVKSEVTSSLANNDDITEIIFTWE
jgi:hypothetical protein